MARALFPGSFDPVTLGHIDLIRRAVPVFESVVVGVGVNSSKASLFSVEERIELLQLACSEWPQVTIVAFSGLAVECARQEGAGVILRGIRSGTDFDFESQMAQLNARLNPVIETVFMLPGAEYSCLSSSLIKEIARLGGAIEGLVPGHVGKRLQEKYSRSQS